jgi:hypothetical protein
MEKSQAVARLIGPAMGALGIGLLTSPTAYREIAQQFIASAPYIYFSGMALLIAGLAILNSHSGWTRDWRSLITAVGWVFACVGFFRVIAPPFVAFVGATLFATTTFAVGAGIFFLALGAFFTFKGYVA